MILPFSNGVQQLTGLGWAWQWSALGGEIEETASVPSRVIVLRSGSRVPRALAAGGAGVLPLASGGNVTKKLKIGTAYD